MHVCPPWTCVATQCCRGTSQCRHSWGNRSGLNLTEEVSILRVFFIWICAEYLAYYRTPCAFGPLARSCDHYSVCEHLSFSCLLTPNRKVVPPTPSGGPESHPTPLPPTTSSRALISIVVVPISIIVAVVAGGCLFALCKNRQRRYPVCVCSVVVCVGHLVATNVLT